MLRLAAAGKFQSVQLTAKSNRYKNAWKGNFQSRLQLKNGWGVVQLVGHLTVNAPEAVPHGRAPRSRKPKIANVSAASVNTLPRSVPR